MEQASTLRATSLDDEPPLSLVSGEISSTKSHPISRTTFFRKRFFAETPLAMWNSWHWQLLNRIRMPE